MRERMRDEPHLVSRFFQSIGTFDEIPSDNKSDDVTKDVAHSFRMSARFLGQCINQIFQLIEYYRCFRKEETGSE
jgi:hypothetical protein